MDADTCMRKRRGRGGGTEQLRVDGVGRGRSCIQVCRPLPNTSSIKADEQRLDQGKLTTYY